MAVALTPARPAPADDDTPRLIVSRPSRGDLIFRTVLRIAGLSSFFITAMILIFLIIRGWWALQTDGLSFFTKQNWIFVGNQFGIGGVLPDTLIIGVIACLIAIPVAIFTAIFIAEYAPLKLRRMLVSIIDLMAAIPSIVYGLWGRFWLMPRALGTMSWLSHHVGWFPPFRVTILVSASTYVGSAMIAGMVVSLMCIPIITSLSREVFSQAPQGEREAAYALGSTKWGMVRTVVLPFGKGGVIGACMLGIGRALGETIAVLLIVSPTFSLNWHVLQSGADSVAALIAGRWASAGSHELSALMAAGLVLFAITLAVNSLAGIVINRSRSGAQTAD
ncbi:MAG TPA: phosphate ABC transporter permease subunit PstC [Streptosporangiaceae bacterium]|jgi:phosphate transport system permease protein|nr:phosphate ABC transporter permease subunit PstC [Streptosporangiaceae bacterium]